MEEEQVRFSPRTVNHSSNITGTDEGSKVHDEMTNRRIMWTLRV